MACALSDDSRSFSQFLSGSRFRAQNASQCVSLDDERHARRVLPARSERLSSRALRSCTNTEHCQSCSGPLYRALCRALKMCNPVLRQDGRRDRRREELLTVHDRTQFGSASVSVSVTGSVVRDGFGVRDGFVSSGRGGLESQGSPKVVHVDAVVGQRETKSGDA
jgi:hypothetical protein